MMTQLCRHISVHSLDASIITRNVIYVCLSSCRISFAFLRRLTSLFCSVGLLYMSSCV